MGYLVCFQFHLKWYFLTLAIHQLKLVEKKNYKVNTFHSKVIDKLGSDMTTFLISDDGEIEGIYNLEKKGGENLRLLKNWFVFLITFSLVSDE